MVHAVVEEVLCVKSSTMKDLAEQIFSMEMVLLKDITVRSVTD